jgi:NADPH:quinone reductase-like Zn-dependent oxidoreductase
MKAIVYHRYGTPDVLALEDVDVPVPQDNQVLIRIRAASVNPYDWHFITGTPYLMRLTAGGLRRPRQTIPGVDLAGQVEAVGRDVTRFRPGDEVYAVRAGAFAEYVCAREDRVARKPTNLTFEQAAAVPLAALTALQALRDHGRVQPGQRVLVNGASGGIGTFAVQLGKAFGAEVTAVCSTRNVDLVRGLGADRVIDYTQEDFVQSGQRYDLMVDIAGNRSIRERRRVLIPQGTLVVVGGPKTNRWIGPMSMFVTMPVASRLGSQRMVGMMTQNSVADLDLLRDLLEAGTVTPVVERRLSLLDVPEAVGYVGAGHAQGKLVIAV